jgi:4-cresol dehydrogenase (hydroxylating)
MADLLPPGLTAATFAEALDRFRAAIGPEFVFTSEADRASYLDPFDIEPQDVHAPAAAIAPGDVDGLRKILAVAERYRVALWPVSMGKNFAYGTAAPRQRGTVVLDLKRMNRILELNEELGYAVVEPGVSFFDLKAELDRRKSGLWMSGPSHSWGSVIGNALEHGLGYTPYGIHADTICGMEVMLADGTLVRTGYGALDNSQEWQCYKWPFGPALDGLFTQSNFGIVTRMGLWLMPELDEVAGVDIDVPNKDDLARLIDTLRPLKLNDTINATYTLANGWRQITTGAVRTELYDGPGAIPEALVHDELRRRGKGFWSVTFNLFDREGAMDSRLAAIERAFAATLPAARLSIRRWRKGEPRLPWLRQDTGVSVLGIADWRGSPGGHTDFAPVVAPIGQRAADVYLTMESRFSEYGIDPWIGCFGAGGRALIFVADMFYARNDPAMTERCRRLFRQLCGEMQAKGIGLYRTHLAFMDDAAAMHGWGDGALPRLNERIKQALDPQGILAPGKQGIGGRAA